MYDEPDAPVASSQTTHDSKWAGLNWRALFRERHRHPTSASPQTGFKLLFASGSTTLRHVVIQQAPPGGRDGGAPNKAGLLASPFSTTVTSAMQEVVGGSCREKDQAAIRGSGWVVGSLEAALWYFLHGKYFEDAILRAANLGDDTDTTAASAGQLVDAFFGADALPKLWRERLALGDEIAALSRHLAEGPNDKAGHLRL